MNKNQSKSVKNLISGQTAIATLFFCFRLVFVFCMLINKSVLKWILLIIRREHTLTRSTNFFSRNHPLLCFSRCLILNKSFIKLTKSITTFKYLCWSLLFNLKGDSNTCFPVANFLRTAMLKKIWLRLHLK